MTRKLTFGDANYHVLKTSLGKELKEALNKVQDLDQNQYFKRAVQRFRDVITPSEDIDVGVLPVLVRNNARSKTHCKINCVLCLISHTVQLYWKLFQGDKSKEQAIRNNIAVLGVFAKHGLGAYKVAGKLSTGYYLETK